jgi:hypothetical protein
MFFKIIVVFVYIPTLAFLLYTTEKNIKINIKKIATIQVPYVCIKVW